MRRNLEEKEAIQILENNYIAHLAYISGSSPYIVPVTYYYDSETHTIISYSSEGHKISAMRKNPVVSICVNEIKTVADWKSVLVHGIYEELKRIDAKHMLHRFSKGIKDIIHRTEEKQAQFISDFSAKIEKQEMPLVFRIQINEIIGKQRQL